MSYKERLKEALENVSLQADTTWSLADTTLYQKCNLELYLTENHLQRSKFQRYRPRTVRECIPESKLAQYSNYGYNESREMSYATSIDQGMPPPVHPLPVSEPWEMGEVDELFAWFLKDLHEDNFSRLEATDGGGKTHESPLLKVHGFEDRILKIRLSEDRVKNIWKAHVEDEMLPGKKTKDVLVNIYMSPLGNFFVTNNKRGCLADDCGADMRDNCDWFRNISISKDFEQLQQLSKRLQKQKTWIVKSMIETIEATTQHHHVSLAPPVAPPTILIEQKHTTTTTTKTATEILYSEVLQGLLPSKKNKQAQQQQQQHHEKPPTPPTPVEPTKLTAAAEETQAAAAPATKASDQSESKKEPSKSNNSFYQYHQRNQQHHQQYYSNVAASSKPQQQQQQQYQPSMVENRSSYSSVRCINSFQTSSANSSNGSFQQTWRWRQQYQQDAAAASSSSSARMVQRTTPQAQQQQANLNGGQSVQVQQQPQMSTSYVQHQSYYYSPVQRWLPLGSYPTSQLISSSWLTQNQAMMNNYHPQVSPKPQWNSFEIKDIFNRRDILRSYFLDDVDKDPTLHSSAAAAASTSFAGIEIETSATATTTTTTTGRGGAAVTATEGVFKEHQVSASISEELEIQALEQYSNSNENFYQELERQATEQYRNSPE